MYSHISELTKIVTSINKLKEQASKKLKEIEKSRIKATGLLPKSMSLQTENNEKFAEQNELLLEELTKEGDLIEKTQEAAFQLSALLKFFQQKISEQENMSISILNNAEDSVLYMKTANKHLNSANETSKGMEKV